jgi:hypothetical protein
MGGRIAWSDLAARRADRSRRSMKTNFYKTVGDVVVAAFDEAAHYSSDPRKVSHLATRAVLRMLRRARRLQRASGPMPVGVS